MSAQLILQNQPLFSSNYLKINEKHSDSLNWFFFIRSMACVYFSEELKLTQFERLGEFHSNAVFLTVASKPSPCELQQPQGKRDEHWLRPYFPFS